MATTGRCPSPDAQRRTKKSRPGLAPIAALALLASACGALPPEEQLLAEFFRASRLRDLTVLRGMATVEFHPRADGIVESFEVGDSETMPSEDGAEMSRLRVRAQVRRPDGAAEGQTLLVTVRRGADGRWMVTGLSRADP